MRKPIAIVLAVLSLSGAAPRVAAAAETVKVAVPDRGAWNTSYTELGLQQGFFREQGLDLQIIYVADEAQEAGVDDARLVPIGAADNGYPQVAKRPARCLVERCSGRAAMIHRECRMRRFGSTPSTRTF